MSYTEHRFRTADGPMLYYRSYGEGPRTIICLPGLTRNCKDFERLAEHLAPNYRVITPDLRGRGQSEWDPKMARYVPPTYVRDVWGLLDELGIYEVTVIGTSLGGLMAMIMSDQNASRLRGVVMNDVGPEIPPEAIVRILAYVGSTPSQPDWKAAAERVQENYGIAFPDRDEAFWDDQVRLAWREEPDGTVTPDHDPAIGAALLKVAKAARFLGWLQKLGVKRMKGVNLDRWDDFRQMSMPVLLLQGELSDILTSEIVGRMQAVKPDLQVTVVPACGHAPTLDEPEARAAIDAFLDRL